MGNLEEETKRILKENKLYANKKLGQNFLIKDEIIEKIICEATVNQSDLIIEIGPGIGALTKALLEKAGRVVCIELDDNMIPILMNRFGTNQKFELIHQDVLKVNLKNLIIDQKKNYKFNNVKVVANLPYYITTPIIMKLLEEKLEIQSITVMVQKEVAQRLTAKPGDEYTGTITYAIYYYTQPRVIVHVQKESFIPSPEVDSAVIQLNLLEKPRVKVTNELLFFKVIKSAFMQKRKTLVNALDSSKLIEKQKLQGLLNKIGLDEKIRGEKMTIEDFAKLVELIDENVKK